MYYEKSILNTDGEQSDVVGKLSEPSFWAEVRK